MKRGIRREDFERIMVRFIPRCVHPNHLTFFRLTSIPILLLSETAGATPAAQLPLLVLSGLSDFFDGAVARVRNQITWLGTVLDPLADKLLTLYLIIFLWRREVVGWNFIFWIAILESHLLLVPGLRFFQFSRVGKRKIGAILKVSPNVLGKAKFFGLMVTFSFLFYGVSFGSRMVLALAGVIFWVTILVGLLAVFHYVWSVFRTPRADVRRAWSPIERESV